MTSCGGTCQKVPGGAIIKLSQPLLTLRPSRDLKMVLLHEMIHAHCMVERIRDPDPGGHGPPFQSIMKKINIATCLDPQRPPGGYNVTVYHTMHDEVNFYRQHHWRCERCGVEVHRAMNRKPQEADCRQRAGAGCTDVRCNWHMHLKTCGGDYVKVKEPENYGQKRIKKKAKTIDSDIGGESAAAAAESNGGGAGGSNRKKINAGQPPITNWFRTGLGKTLDSPAQPSSDQTPLPSIAAVLGRQHDQGKSTHNRATATSVGDFNNNPTTVEEQRRLLEAAAIRRLQLQGGIEVALSTHKQSSNDPAGPSSLEVISLIDSDKDEGSDKSVIPGRGNELSVGLSGPYFCPVCNTALPNNNIVINSHLDDCLAKNA